MEISDPIWRFRRLSVVLECNVAAEGNDVLSFVQLTSLFTAQVANVLHTL